MITKVDLQGAWVLSRFLITKPRGTAQHWRTNYTGILLYCNDYVSVNINGDLSKLPTPECTSYHAELHKNTLCYAGTYSINGNEITHHVTEASSPERIGHEEKRIAILTSDGENLTLSAFGNYGGAELRWTKASS